LETARLILREATEADVGHILRAGLREADKIEAFRMTGRDPYEALHASWALSSHRYIVELDGQPKAFAGCAPLGLLGSVGVPWLITTEDAPQHWRRFLRMSCVIMRRFVASYDRLQNRVDVDNTASIRWLKWLGFTVHENNPVPFGPGQFPFYPFELEV